MTRRLVLAAGALAAAVSISSCSTFDRNDVVATVHGNKLTRTELNTLANGVVAGDSLRTTISQWLQLGVMGGDTTHLKSTGDMTTQMTTLIANFLAPYLPAAQHSYELGLDGAPLYCLRAIPVQSPNTTDQVLAAVTTGGVSWADAASKYSADATLAGNGGLIVNSSGGACLAPSELSSNLIQTLKTAGAKVGVPLKLQFGNLDLVMELRPFSDLSNSEKAEFAQGQIATELKAKLQGSQIYVNPRYGRWDSASATVVALGG